MENNIKSVYIHIPFCKKKCLYCDFNSYENKEGLIDSYILALKKEIKSKQIDTLSTIYIGGGTPSFINENHIKEILNLLPKADEITIEMNPCTVTKEKLETYKACGINRISIGLQTTNDNILKEIGRAHNFETFKKAYELARSVGFNNVNVDLMFGLPKQTLDDLKKSVNYLISINPEHISCYSLIMHNNIFKNLPSDDEEREMYYYTKKVLKEAGYIHYEISNFAKTGYESKHNLVYWNDEEYYGFGAGASSYVDKIRYTNESSIEKYILKINQGEDIRNIEEKQDLETNLREYIILRLRLMDGVNFDKVKGKFEIDMRDVFKEEIEELLKKELIEIDSNNMKLTSKGMDFANIVWSEFV